MPEDEEPYLEFPVFNHPSFDTSKNKRALDNKIIQILKQLFDKFEDSHSADCEFDPNNGQNFGLLTVTMYRNEYTHEKPLRVIRNPIFYYSPN